MRRPLGLSVGLAAALSLTLPAAARAQVSVGQLEIGDSLPLQVGQSERLTSYVTARTRSGRLIQRPRIAFRSLDTSVVEVKGDTAVAKQPGTAMVIVSAAGGRKPVEDTVVVTVEPPGEPPAQLADTSALPIETGIARGAVRPGRATSQPPDTLLVPDESPLSRLPAGTVLTPEPNPVQLLLHETVVVVPHVRRAEDNADVGVVKAGWQSLSPDVVRVDSTGLVTAVGIGTGAIQVKAVAGGTPRTISVTVDTARLGFARTRLAIPVGEQRTLTVVVPRQGGRKLDNSMLSWRSTDQRIAIVGATGIVTAREPGRAQVIADGFLRADTLLVVVHPKVETISYSPSSKGAPLTVPLRGVQKFSVVMRAANSDTVKGVPLSWAVGDTAIARFDTVSLALTGKAVGSTQLTLRPELEGFPEQSWKIDVVPAHVALDHDRLALPRGKRQALVASMVDDSGKVVGPLRGGQWHSTDASVAVVSPNGELETKGLGRTLVSVTGPAGRSDTAEIFVVADLLVASNRAGARPGIYQISLAQLDDLIPLLVDSATYVGAAYSPDRTQIAFSSVRNKSLGIHIMGADGRRPARQVLRAIGSKTALAWIPDGRRLVFTIGDKRATAIGRLDLRTNSWDTVTVVAGEPSPDVSGAGKIVYAAGEKNSSYVYTIGLEGRTPVRLPNTAGRELSPRWLPTGDLLFITEGDRKGGRFRIVRYEPRTGVQTPLVASEAPILSLAVSRDGATMAYIKKGPNGRSPSALFVQGTAPGSTAREVPLRPGEAITALSF